VGLPQIVGVALHRLEYVDQFALAVLQLAHELRAHLYELAVSLRLLLSAGRLGAPIRRAYADGQPGAAADIDIGGARRRWRQGDSREKKGHRQ